MSIDLVMLSNHLILCCLLLILSLFFASTRAFSNELALYIRWPKYWSFNFSICPFMNIQYLFPLKLAGLISLQSKGLSRVFSSTTIQSINSLALSLLYGSTLTSIYDYWKNHSFNYVDIYLQSDASAFEYAV